jgi:hypothetical protein
MRMPVHARVKIFFLSPKTLERPGFFVNHINAFTNKRDQITRWESISRAVADERALQYRGKTPHDAKAATDKRVPLVDSFMHLSF